MGLTERHWFEDEEPELTENQLEDILWENNKIFERGYQKGFFDGKSDILREQEPVIVRCKDCIHSCDYTDIFPTRAYKCTKNGGYHNDSWFCADGERRPLPEPPKEET